MKNKYSILLSLYIIAILTLFSCSTNKVSITHSHDGNYSHCSICQNLIKTNKNSAPDNYTSDDHKVIKYNVEVEPLSQEEAVSTSNININKESTNKEFTEKNFETPIYNNNYKESETSISTKENIAEGIIQDQSNNEEKGINPWALAGLIIGISGLLLSFTIVAPFFAGIFGTIFSAIGISKSNRKSKSRTIAIIGFILSFIQLMFFVTVFILLVLYF